MVDPSKYCPKCKTWYIATPSFYANRARRDGLSVLCKRCHVEATSKEAQALRKRAIEHLGGACIHCGYDIDTRALCFDHINGDGYLERKRGQRPSAQRLAQQILDGRKDIQLLCFNCNQIKKTIEKEYGDRRASEVVPDFSHDPAPPPDGRFVGIGDRWSKDHDACLDCGRTDRRHGGFGFCATCYARKENRERIHDLRQQSSVSQGIAARSVGAEELRRQRISASYQSR